MSSSSGIGSWSSRRPSGSASRRHPRSAPRPGAGAWSWRPGSPSAYSSSTRIGSAGHEEGDQGERADPPSAAPAMKLRRSSPVIPSRGRGAAAHGAPPPREIALRVHVARLTRPHTTATPASRRTSSRDARQHGDDQPGERRHGQPARPPRRQSTNHSTCSPSTRAAGRSDPPDRTARSAAALSAPMTTKMTPRAALEPGR